MTFHPTEETKIWARMTRGVGVILGVQPGMAQIRVSGRGYYSQVEDVLIASSPAEQELRLIVEPSARIAVRFVTPDGRRLFDVLKELMPAQQAFAIMPSIFASRLGDLPPFTPSGDFNYLSPDAMWGDPRELVRLQSGLDGELSLKTRPPMMLHALLRHRSVGMHALEAPIEALDFVVEPERLLAELGSIRVRLLDGLTGEPFAAGAGSVSLGGARSSMRLARADDGMHSLERLPPGAYVLSATAKDRASWRQVLLLEPGAACDAGEIRLQTPAFAQLRLIDPEGQPIVKARVWSLDLRATTNLFQVGNSYNQSGADGGVKFERLEPVPHYFTFRPPVESKLGVGYLRHTPGQDGGVPVEVRLAPGVPVHLLPQGEDLLQRGVWILIDGVAPVPVVRYDYLPATVFLAPGEHAWMVLDAAGRELRRGAILVEQAMTELRVEVPLP
jgi:hypothetical protein